MSMTIPKTLDVTGIGNAIVDILANVDDAFLHRHSLHKSAMTLINRQEAHTLYHAMPPALQCSGGSAANTVAGIASLGGKAAFLGKVNLDALGEFFTHDIRALGIYYPTIPATGNGATARCLVSITPDAQRTMATYLGDQVELTWHDIDERAIAAARILYIEGYLWDSPRTKQAILEAMRLARKYHTKIAFTLSDAFCVQRHRHEFLELVDEYVDILFANEQEITTLLHIEDFDTVARHISRRCNLAALTRGEKGSVIVMPDAYYTIQPLVSIKVNDTTGAGDLYASGFLYGITHSYPIEKSGLLANICASYIIGQYGARPALKLDRLDPYRK